MEKQKLAIGGSILSAIAASACCIGPLVAVILGASGFAASAFFAKWRPLFLGVTFVLLGLAWIVTYRKPRESCGDGAACATKPMAKWNKPLLWAATAFVVITSAFPPLYALATKVCCSLPPVAVATAQSASLKVKIPSMDCEACAASIEATLQKQSGVQNVRVSFDTKEAHVQYDASKISGDEIIAVIDKTGFKAEPTTPKERR